MPIMVTCSRCGATYALPEDRAGQTGHCKCGASIHVPGAGEPAVPPPGRSSRPRAAAPSAGGPSVECIHCGMQTAPGAKCQWCGEPLGPRHVEEEHSVLIGGGVPHPAAAAEAYRQRRQAATTRGPDAPPPTAVVVIRVLYLLGLIFGGLSLVALAIGAGSVVRLLGLPPAAQGALLVGAGIGVVCYGLTVWLYVALRRASTVAWWIYTVLLGLDLLCAPINLVSALSTPAKVAGAAGMAGFKVSLIGWNVFFLLLVVIVLVAWLQRPVKEWYGVV